MKAINGIGQEITVNLKTEEAKAESVLSDLLHFRAELAKFFLICEQKLIENDHKRHWSDCDMGYLTKRLHDEFGELKRAIDKKAPHLTVARECADIANFAMMIADTYAPEEM